MKTLKKLGLVTLISVLMLSCGKEGKSRALDFTPIKEELKLSAEKSTKFDEITAKYQKLMKETYEANKAQKGDRIAMMTKMEEIRNQQAEEMSTLLNEDEMTKFTEFVDKNSRKRPRYTDELLGQIKTNAELTDEQMQVVDAANNAFEKAFSDAHDVYHGNNDLAKEYWEKFDTQRKAAIEKALLPEQFQKYKETVSNIQFKGRE